MPEIDILMATYNGAKYVDKQILSIVSQTYRDWRLLIHDDGSDDGTVDIIKDFCNLDTRIKYVQDGYLIKNAALHFMYMLRWATSPFLCFCDQDDIWLENKLESMLAVIVKKNNAIPQVVFSDAYLFYADRNCIRGHLLCTQPHTLKELLFTNGGIHGSASMFNQAMKQCINRYYSFVSMHDHILTLAGCSLGEITYINQKLFLYRQHEHNLTGNMEVGPFKRFKRAFDFKNRSATLRWETIKGVKAFAIAHEKDLSDKDKQLIGEYLSFPRRNILSILWKVLLRGYSINDSRIHLWIKLITRKFISPRP